MSIVDLLHNNALADNDLLAKNNAMGDMFSQPRDVDFTFKTTSKDGAEGLCEFIKGKNFGNARINKGDDGLYWIIVVIHMPITQNLLCSVSGFMACLGGLFKVEYDGWGSVIQKA
jgi:hypothetical protein